MLSGPFEEDPFSKDMMTQYKNGKEEPHAYKTAKMLHEVRPPARSCWMLESVDTSLSSKQREADWFIVQQTMRGEQNQCLIIT